MLYKLLLICNVKHHRRDDGGLVSCVYMPRMCYVRSENISNPTPYRFKVLGDYPY